MKSRDEVEVRHQYRFGTDGELEADEDTETNLVDWGVVEGEQERETKYEEPRASEFGKDDRKSVERSESEQVGLFVDVDEGQKTLGGQDAQGQSRWSDE